MQKILIFLRRYGAERSAGLRHLGVAVIVRSIVISGSFICLLIFRSLTAGMFAWAIRGLFPAMAGNCPSHKGGLFLHHAAQK